VHAGDALDARDLVEQQILVGVHVPDHHLQLVIRLLAGDQQAFEISGISAMARLQIGEALRRVLVHRNADQRHQRQAQFFGIEHGAIAGDQAGLFQRAHPAQAGRRRQADAVGQILIADAAICCRISRICRS
jgi:hypothetical protein